MSRLRAHLTYANVMATVAMFLALGLGSAWAADQLSKNEVRSKHIKNGEVKSPDLARNAVSTEKVANGSLLGEDFALDELPAGTRGPQGPQGLRGQQGLQGEPGEDGSPDDPHQVLSKLRDVDGSGSDLVADLLDGKDASEFTPAGLVHERTTTVPYTPDPFGLPSANTRPLGTVGPFEFIAVCGFAGGVGGEYVSIEVVAPDTGTTTMVPQSGDPGMTAQQFSGGRQVFHVFGENKPTYRSVAFVAPDGRTFFGQFYVAKSGDCFVALGGILSD